MTRELEFRPVLDQVLSLYRANAGPLITLAAVVFLPVAFLTALLQNSNQAAGIVTQVVLSGPTTFLYAGLAAPVVVRARTGGLPAEPGDMLDSVQPVAGALLIAGLIWVVAAVLGFAALIVPGIIWVTIALLTPSAITLERHGVIEAFRRSRELVRGNGTTVFAILLALGVALIVTGLLLQALGNAVGGAAGAFVGSWLAAVLTAPPAGLLPNVVFLDLGGKVEPIEPGGAEEGEEERRPGEPKEDESDEDDERAEDGRGADRKRDEGDGEDEQGQRAATGAGEEEAGEGEPEERRAAEPG
jgi:hypothetical protein